MKAKELMIGDYVHIGELDKYSGCNGKIVSLNFHKEEDGAYFLVFVSGDKGCATTEVFNEDIEPIPLTPEILEKNGFKPYIPEGHLETVYACQDVSKAIANELYALWPYQDGSFYLLLIVDGKDMVRMDVHYIHQLQHALRLCGIEKEIVV